MPPIPPKSWWAPVWRGLVVDPAGKHLRSLDGAVWLLLYLILHAERRSGVVRCRRATISRSMGAPARTVQRWLRRLRERNYVTVEESGRVLRIAILRWKAFGSRASGGAESATNVPPGRQRWRDPPSAAGRDVRYL